ncbi:MAG: ATP-binding protein [Planctomycetota bacterium]
MISNPTSARWPVFGALIALGFIGVSVTLMLDVNRSRNQLAEHVRLTSALLDAEQCLSGFPRGRELAAVAETEPGWERRMQELDEHVAAATPRRKGAAPAPNVPLGVSVDELRDAFRNWVELGRSSGRAAGERYDASLDRARRAVRDRLGEERDASADVSLRLGRRWRDTYATLMASWLIAAGSAWLLWRSQRHSAELQRAQEALRTTEDRLGTVVANAPVACWSVDRGGSITLSEGAALEAIGVRPGELVGESMFELYHDHPDVVQNVQLALSGTPVEYTVEVEGAVFHTYLFPFHDKAGRVVGANGVSTNITDRARIESQLRQSEQQRHEAQKAEAIGRVAGGVAHEFSNLLTVVTGFSSLLRDGFEPGSQERDDATQILQASKRAAELTQQLLAFSRQQRSEPRVVDLSAVLENSLKMLRTLVGETIDVRVQVGSGTYPVLIDPGQFQQVLVNLTLNARDAMPDGGTLTLAITDVSPADVADNAFLEPGHYLCLQVRDTGAGMEPGVVAHAFEPFFTTKEPGAGTGLGLPTCQGLLRQAGGDITVESEPGKGTTFRLFLARHHATAVSSDPETTEISLSRGLETVLLAEDEAMVRAFASRVLRGAGYNVIEASDGNRALEICRSYVGSIDLLITDLVMPGLGGRQLAERFQEVRPETPVVFISGYAQEDSSIEYLQKPFSPKDLCRAARARLDAYHFNRRS